MTTLRSARVLTTLEAAIRNSTDRVRADCLSAEYAAQLIRHKRVDEGVAILAHLRGCYGRNAQVSVTSWINFADSFYEAVRGHGDETLDKIRRAHALSKAASLRPLQCLSAAWMAHYLWNNEEPERAVELLREALDGALPDDHAARSRACLTIAEMLALSGGGDDARRWLIAAREHANSNGDEATLSALASNLASIKLTLLKQMTLGGRESDISLAKVGLHIDVSKSVDRTLGFRRDTLSSFQRSEFLSLEGKPLDALQSYAEAMQEDKALSIDRRRCEWLSDQAWCHARLGEMDKALETANDAEKCVIEDTQIDDKAAMYARLAIAYQLIGDSERSANNAAVSEALWQVYGAYQDRCRSLCEIFANQDPTIQTLGSD